VPYPGFQQEWGFLCSVAVMLLIAGGLFFGFRRKGWL